MSRFPQTKVVDYCFNPIHVKDETKDILVPCGKCDGCRLHKANEWSLRLQDEIENCPNSIFFTLTYNNRFLPKLKLVSEDLRHDGSKFYTYVSQHSENIRHNSVSVVPRADDIIIKSSYPPIGIQNSDFVGLNYASKTDIQLWLKLLRQRLYERFYLIYENEDRENRRFFRYYIISEYGPTTYRTHCHGILFPERKVYAECLIDELLFSCWQMCDEGLFKQYTHYCQSGAAQYVTNYSTGFTSLPAVYQENKEIRPFRLASKAPAIGYRFYDKQEVLESINRGDCSYIKSIPRLGVKNVFRYSKDYVYTLFPKCFRYGERVPTRIYLAYACLFIAVRKLGYSFDRVSRFLRKELHVGDYAAALACYRYVTYYKSTVEHYLFLLDSYYYSSAMESLRKQYSYLSNESDVKKIAAYYLNFHEFVSLALNGVGNYPLSLWYFLNAYGFEFSDADLFLHKSFYMDSSCSVDYKREVTSILQDCLKMPKFNELTGNSPHIF